MPQPESTQGAGYLRHQPVTEKDYQALASVLDGKENLQRVHRKDPYGSTLRTAGEMYGNREYVAAYEEFKPVYDRVVPDMQHFCARNAELEATKLARRQQKSLAAAKESIEKRKANAQQVIDQFDRLRHDLESKPLVKLHLRKGGTSGNAKAVPADSTSLLAGDSAIESSAIKDEVSTSEVLVGGRRYRKVPYVPPQLGAVYSVRDKTKGERIIRVVEVSSDGVLVDVESFEGEAQAKKAIRLPVESLVRQAAVGWCSALLPVSPVASPAAAPTAVESAVTIQPAAEDAANNVLMRLDIQNFSRCGADIIRANIRFDTQLIKDVGDGPFRAGNYEHAFRTFEQLTLGFTTAVANSRRAIGEGRRALNAEKGKLSGKEIQERTAAFVRNEQLIHTAEREFSTILEGLRMYLRSRQDERSESSQGE